jgi:hypothetical protein
MKTCRWIILTLLLLILAFVFVWWRSRPVKSSELQATPPTAAVSPSPAPKPGEQAASTPATNAATPSKLEKMSRLLGDLNHKDIEFYGKVVDQAGTPLPDVAVYVSVLYNTGLTSGMVKRETKTDTQGLFSISGMTGRTLGIGLDKPGYEYDGEKGPFHFTELVGEKDRYTPDRKAPVIMTMWKLQGAEPLIHFEQRGYPVPPTGSAVRIDLKTGKHVEVGGDIVVTFWHDEAEAGQRLKRYAWKAELAVPDGGLIPSTSRRMYLAPESGYESTIIVSQTGKEPEYEIGSEKTYYLKTGSGQYARVSIHLTTDTSTKYESYVVLTWWLNPKVGNRNLEFDPAKTVKPQP